ncbi:MAG: hypothetical protein ACK559_23340 [bacterium]
MTLLVKASGRPARAARLVSVAVSDPAGPVAVLALAGGRRLRAWRRRDGREVVGHARPSGGDGRGRAWVLEVDLDGIGREPDQDGDEPAPERDHQPLPWSSV